MSGLETQLLVLVKHFLSTIGYPGIFVLMMVEGFGIPIPSELTMSFSGFLASAAGGSKFYLPVAIGVGTLGETTGAILAYALGYHGGRRIIVRYGRFVMLSDAELDRAEEWFGRYGDWIVLVGRLLPAIRGFIGLPAGVVRMPIGRFLGYTVVGCLIWCTVLAVIGHALGQNWDAVSREGHRYNVVILILAAAIVAFVVYRRKFAGGDEEDVIAKDDEEAEDTAASGRR